MPYKFEQLDVWKLSLEYIDSIYQLAEQLPKSEEYNLNIAEGSTGQSDAEQARFLGFAIRSLIETVACHHIIQRRGYIQDHTLLTKIYEDSQVLARKLQSFRKTVAPYQVKEEQSNYGEDDLP